MIERNKLNCLHTPALYEGENAFLYWQAVPGATEYELDAVYDTTIKAATTGLSWRDVGLSPGSWADFEVSAPTWAHFEERPARGRTWGSLAFDGLTWTEMEEKNLRWEDVRTLPVSLTVWRGAGRHAPVPELGLSWRELEQPHRCQDEMREGDTAWQVFETHKQHGLSFIQLEREDCTWGDMARLGADDGGPTWREMENLPARGLTWEAMDAGYTTWAQREAHAHSWRGLGRQPPDNEPHLGCTLPIPCGHGHAQFRLRARQPDGAYTPYIQTDSKYMIETDEAYLITDAGENAVVLAQGLLMRSYEDTKLTLRYDKGHLRLAGLHLTAGGHALPPGAHLQVLENKNGVLRFTCQRAVPPAFLQNALLVLFSFIATKNGPVLLRIERERHSANKLTN